MMKYYLIIFVNRSSQYSTASLSMPGPAVRTAARDPDFWLATVRLLAPRGYGRPYSLKAFFVHWDTLLGPPAQGKDAARFPNRQLIQTRLTPQTLMIKR